MQASVTDFLQDIQINNFICVDPYNHIIYGKIMALEAGDSLMLPDIILEGETY